MYNQNNQNINKKQQEYRLPVFYNVLQSSHDYDIDDLDDLESRGQREKKNYSQRDMQGNNDKKGVGLGLKRKNYVYDVQNQDLKQSKDKKDSQRGIKTNYSRKNQQKQNKEMANILSNPKSKKSSVYRQNSQQTLNQKNYINIDESVDDLSLGQEMSEKNSPKNQTNHINSPKYPQNQKQYQNMLKLCQSFRKQNLLLKQQVSNLKSKINLMKSQSTHYISSQQYVKRIQNLQYEYQKYKQNLHDSFRKDMKDVYKIVDYIFMCYQQYSISNNKKLKQVLDQVMGDSTHKILANKKLSKDKNNDEGKQSKIDKLIRVYESYKFPKSKNVKEQKILTGSLAQTSNDTKNQYQQMKNLRYYCNNDLFGNKQCQILRKRAKQLQNYIEVLITLCKNELIKLRAEVTGNCEKVKQQFKQCILVNFETMTGKQNMKISKKYQNHQNQMERSLGDFIRIQENSRSKSKIKCEQRKSVQKLNKSKSKDICKKKLSLGNSVELSLIHRPPLPPTSFLTTKNKDFCIKSSEGNTLSLNQGNIKNTLNYICIPTPKQPRPSTGTQHKANSQSKSHSQRKNI